MTSAAQILCEFKVSLEAEVRSLLALEIILCKGPEGHRKKLGASLSSFIHRYTFIIKVCQSLLTHIL